MPLRCALSRVAVSACGSMSTATLAAPSSRRRRRGCPSRSRNRARRGRRFGGQPFQAERGGGVRAAAERETRVEQQDDGRVGGRTARADPQAFAAVAAEVLRQSRSQGRSSSSQRHAAAPASRQQRGECRAGGSGVGVLVEQPDQVDLVPQRGFPDAGSSTGLSPWSASVTARAPAASRASSTALGAVGGHHQAQLLPAHRECSQPQLLLQVVNVHAAALEVARRAPDCWCSGMLVLMPSTTISSSAVRMRASALCAVVAVGDDLADQRVVVRRHAVAVVEVRVDAHAVAARRVEGRHLAGAGHEGVRVLGIDAALERVAAKLHVLLA